MPVKIVRCYCGFIAEGEDAELVTSVQVHVRDIHQMEYTPEEVLAIAEPVPGARSLRSMFRRRSRR